MTAAQKDNAKLVVDFPFLAPLFDTPALMHAQSLAARSLLRGGYRDAGSVRSATDEELRGIPNLGAKSVDLIRTAFGRTFS